MARPVLVFLLLNGDTRQRNFSCLAPFFDLPPYAERAKKPSDYCNFLLLPMAGIKPELPLQQKSVPSITPWPLSEYLQDTFD